MLGTEYLHQRIILFIIYVSTIFPWAVSGQSCECLIHEDAIVEITDQNSYLNVRSFGSVNSQIIGRFSNKDIVNICYDGNNHGDWKKVTYKGNIGYVSSQFLRVLPKNNYFYLKDGRVFYDSLKISTIAKVYSIDSLGFLQREKIPFGTTRKFSENELESQLSTNSNGIVFIDLNDRLSTIDLQGAINVNMKVEIGGFYDISYHGQNISITATGITTDSSSCIENYRLSLIDRNEGVEIMSIGCITLCEWLPGNYEGSLNIKIVGDFNADGETDVIYEVSNHYASKEYRMILSRENEYDDLHLISISSC